MLKQKIQEILDEIKLQYCRLVMDTLEEYHDIISNYKSKYVPMHILLYELSRIKYLYDLFGIVESSEEIKNDLVTDQLYKYSQKYPAIYPVKE